MSKTGRLSQAAVLLGTFILLGAAVAMYAADERPNQVREFMRPKLLHSQKVLEGLTLANFDLIAKNAQDLSLLSQESGFRVLQTPDYLHEAQEFRRIADRLTTAARDKNLDGATLAYMELTLTCVQCHKHVRDQAK